MKTPTSTTREGTKQSKSNLPSEKNAVVAVVGLGYVGLPLALEADRKGHRVIGFDTKASLVGDLKKRKAPDFLEHADADWVTRTRMKVSSDEGVLSDADIFVICVPTPVFHDHEPDLGALRSATEIVARAVRPGSLVIVESTVNPGVCDEIVIPMIESISHLEVEVDFQFAYCPERINPGDSKWDVRSIPRVLGGNGPVSLTRAKKFYESVIDSPIHPMKSIKEAEAVKIMENSFRDINIAFVNELAMSFKRLNIDITNVLRGASTKPFGFMAHYPGCGVGGHCIPVDPYYLISYAKQNGFIHRFLETARSINNHMPLYTVSLLENALHERGLRLQGASIALLGLAYKRDIPDVRESPALIIRDTLLARGAQVRAYDPYVRNESSVASLSEALRGADAVLIATDHSAFTTIAPADLISAGTSIMIDGRNCLDKDAFTRAGITYHGIGR